MDLKVYLQEFAKESCPCGKSHAITIPEIVTGAGAIEKIPEILKKANVKKAFVLADKNTFAAAGERVLEILKNAGIAHSAYCFSSEKVVPSEVSLGEAIMHFDHAADFVISVGSGVLNDIGKIVSKTAKTPYMIVGTAPSMDGYASASSSMDLHGLKTSLPSKCPEYIVGDTDILKNAPEKMLQAGLGDMLAKFVSLAEWKIAREIVGEYYCERVANLVKIALDKCVQNADGLLKRDEKAVEAVFEGLVIGGVAMALAGVSRPASGAEHYISHIWDMRGLEFGTSVDLHGIQCAIGTRIAAGLYEKALLLKPDKEKAIAHAKSFDLSAWNETLRVFLGTGANAMIAMEEKEGKYSVENHQKRLETLLKKWDTVCEIIKKEIPTQKEIEKILQAIGAPLSAEEIGIECDLSLTVKATKDIRFKYIVSNLLWDLGVLDELV